VRNWGPRDDNDGICKSPAGIENKYDVAIANRREASQIIDLEMAANGGVYVDFERSSGIETDVVEFAEPSEAAHDQRLSL
jgi:hypothetical protein